MQGAQPLEGRSDGKPQRQIKLNPHIEAHGNYSIEWSYHFPLQPGLRIESEFMVGFPSEKVPGAARVSLSEANLATTRLSFADSATDVRRLSLKFLTDTRWLTGVLSPKIQKSEASLLHNNNAGNVRTFFLNRAREYWTPTFLSRVGIILQSDLKKSTNDIKACLKAFDPHVGVDWARLALEKRQCQASLRAAFRLVEVRTLLEGVFQDPQPQPQPQPQPPLPQLPPSLPALLAQVRDLSELAIGLVSQAVADLQGQCIDVARLCEDGLEVLSHNASDDQEDARQIHASFEIYQATLRRIRQEQTWLVEWARLCNEWCLKCGLPPLSEVSLDSNAATLFFERLRGLKKQHYHVWDLALDLRPNEKRFGFLIGAIAAGISASFAFVATLFLAIDPFGNNLSLRYQGTVAIAVFTLANVIIYIAKDRLKEWLKVRLNDFLHIRSNRWVGNCVLSLPSPSGGRAKLIEVANIERESWWEKVRESWNFQVWEEFRITPEARSTDARIIKQVWRLPLDEILHSLDNTRYVLKLPAMDGIPKEIPVLKRLAFPYKLLVTVRTWQNKQLVVVDTAQIEGRIITSGDRILVVE